MMMRPDSEQAEISCSQGFPPTHALIRGFLTLNPHWFTNIINNYEAVECPLEDQVDRWHQDVSWAINDISAKWLYEHVSKLKPVYYDLICSFADQDSIVGAKQPRLATPAGGAQARSNSIQTAPRRFARLAPKIISADPGTLVITKPVWHHIPRSATVHQSFTSQTLAASFI